MWVQLDRPGSSALTTYCDTQGLSLVAGPKFSIDGGFERYLRLPFTSPLQEIEAGVRRLALAWDQLSARDAGTPREERMPQLV